MDDIFKKQHIESFRYVLDDIDGATRELCYYCEEYKDYVMSCCVCMITCCLICRKFGQCQNCKEKTCDDCFASDNDGRCYHKICENLHICQWRGCCKNCAK